MACENRVYLAGACNVGKSILASILLGEEIPQSVKSTDGLIIYYGRNGN
jgi:tRNA U34 5-carboxymethylaminomethyl modifying GTPase MnmE/TrmE